MRVRSKEAPSTAARPGRWRRLLRFSWRWGLRPLLVLILALAALHWGEKGVFAIRASTLSETQRLREDLARLERLLLREHPSPFRNASREEVEGALERARAAVERYGRGDLEREGVLAHFAEAVTSLRDPHTTFVGRYDLFGILRISPALFGDEVRLLGAPEDADLGARVLSFDGVPTAAVLAAIRPLAAAPNPSSFLDDAPRILRSPGLLLHAGVVADSSRVTLAVERLDGTRASLVLPRLTLEEYLAERPVRHELVNDRLPLYRREDRGATWFEPLPGGAGSYLRIKSSAGFADDSLVGPARQVAAARAEGGGPVIVDLRDNPGGNPQAHVPLVAALAASPSTRGPEHLRVLVNRGTHSASIVAAADLERRAGALVVGEEPGDNAHLTTDARPFTLRHSGFEVWVPTGRMRTAGGAGGRSRLVPARPVAPSFTDWLAGRDPALEVALAPLEAPTSSDSTEALEPAPEVAMDLPTGRFAFDPQRTLTVTATGEGYEASVTALGVDRLVGRQDGTRAGGIHLGLRGSASGSLESRLPSGEWVALAPRPGPSALELVAEGRREEAIRAYLELTAGGSDLDKVAALGLPTEAVYRYREGAAGEGRLLMEIARLLSPADPLIPLQHSLLRREAEGRWMPPAGDFLRALGACWRSYRQAELLNDLRLCL